MTTLPELDSELGVLKFLKWKIRLLSLDVIRSASYQRETTMPEHMELASEDEEMAADLERAEDNAVIRLALAKLNPRQREALVASVYEEKSTEEVAEQLGLTANATRQLMFRAKSAFRKALVGDAEIQGKNISQVLSIAAKKAALDARRNAAKVGAFIVLVAVGIGVVPSLVPAGESIVAEQEIVRPAPVEPESGQVVTPSGTEGPSQSSLPAKSTQSASGDEVDEQPVIDAYEQETEDAPALESAPVLTVQAMTLDNSKLDSVSLGGILSTNVVDAGFYSNSYSQEFAEYFSGVSVEVFGGTGISAFLDLDVQSKTVQKVVYQMWVDGERFYGVARNTESVTEKLDEGFQIEIFSREFFVVDEAGNVFGDSPLAGSSSSVTLSLDAEGSPQSASLKIEQLAD